MAEENDAASKTEDASPRKLEEARRRGEVAKSMEVPQFASLAGAAAAIAISGGWIARNLTEQLLPFVAHPDSIDVHGAGGVEVLRQALQACAPALIVVLGAAAICGAAGNLLQHGLLWSPDKLKFDFSKVSPMGGLKRMFGLDGFIQFLRSLFKIVVTGVIAYLVLKPHAHEMQNLSALAPEAILPLCGQLLRSLVFAVLMALGLNAGLDWLWQRQRFLQKMKMSREELKEDMRQADGDPQIKAKIKQLRIQRSRRRMMQNVPTATVVVTNPTHFAVALRYVAGETAAPVCVAKGMDSLALKIRQVATDASVPVIEDPPLARMLYATVDVDEVIPQQHYEAVAKIIGFVLNAGKRRRRGL